METFTAGGKEELINLLERCACSYVCSLTYSHPCARCTSSLLKTHMEKYKDDIRFLKVFLLYVLSYKRLLSLLTAPQAENCKDATDVYSVIERAQIGSNHGLLYEHWAAWLEDRRNYDAAVETLQLGVYRCAQLQHVHLCVRVCDHPTEAWRLSTLQS